MKTVLAALNAKYIHTSLAIRSVAAYARGQGVDRIVLWERTVNHRYGLLLRELAEQAADVLVLSCYIWNVDLMRRLAADLRLIHPQLVLLAAGPEATYGTDAFLADNPAFDAALPGDGEALTTWVLKRLEPIPPSKRRAAAGALRLADVPAPASLDHLPFPYEDLEELSGRILYYETMRGCPFRCSYCLSSIEDGPVRLRSLELVYQHMERFLAAAPRQVKLVDRTFNCNRERTLALVEWLIGHDNGVTGFHFEVAGELMDDALCDLLATARPGLFQLEIGVQSTNPHTLKAIRRNAQPDRLYAVVRRLQQPRNIHLHLDLIAGLPLENYESFARSFDAVYRLGPDQFQPGFLKVLKGSAMERDAGAYGIRYQGNAPYEVLCTDVLSFPELCRLHGIADMVELYYNSGRFSRLVAEMVQSFDSPFGFYEALAAYFAEQGHHAAPPSKVGYYQILGGFCRKQGILTEKHQWLCRYDMALHEKIKRSPDWVTVDGSMSRRAEILSFLGREDQVARYLPGYDGWDPKALIRTVHLEVFPFHPVTGETRETALLFDYRRRDLLGRAMVQVVPWQEFHTGPING